MNKKHIHPILLAGTLLLAACQQEEILPPSGDASVITFQSPYTVDTRSEAMRAGAFEVGDKVGVLGFCKAKDGGDSTTPWENKKMFCIPDVFYNQELTYQGNGMWTYDWREGVTYKNNNGTFDGKGEVGTLHPWSSNEDDTFAFFAYYPYAANGKVTIDGWEGDDDNGLGTITLSGENERGDPTITYTMPHHVGSSPTSSTCDWWVVPDFMLAYVTDHKKENGSVRLNFRHLFCAFEFEINNYNAEPITVEQLYLGGGTNGRGEGFYRTVTVTGQESDYSVDPKQKYVGRYKLVGRTAGENEHILTRFRCPPATTEVDANGQRVVTAPSTVPLEYNEKPIDIFFIPDENGFLTTDNNESLYIRIQLKSESGTQFGDGGDRLMNLGNQSFQAGTRNIFSINVIGNDYYLQMRSDGMWEEGNSGEGNDIVFE